MATVKTNTTASAALHAKMGEEKSTSSSDVLTLSIDANRASAMRALMT